MSCRRPSPFDSIRANSGHGEMESMAVPDPIIIKINFNKKEDENENCYPIRVDKKTNVVKPEFDENSYIDPIAVCEVKLDLNQNFNDLYNSDDEEMKGFSLEDTVGDQEEVQDASEDIRDLYTDSNGRTNCKFRCCVCGEDYSSKEAVMFHFTTHTKRTYRCYLCKKSCPNRSSLYRHISRHVDLKYPCTICGKLFKDKSYLKIHNNVHTAIRPYGCEVCGSRFKDPSARNKHVKIHSGIKPHKCHICYKRFLRKGDLKLHIHFHTNERPYSCPMCENTYQSSSGYFKHIRLKHHQ